MVIRQELAEPGHGGVVVGQFLRECQRLAVLDLRFRRLARILQQNGEVVAPARQVRYGIG